jgi:hypothetical protein
MTWKKSCEILFIVAVFILGYTCPFGSATYHRQVPTFEQAADMIVGSLEKLNDQMEKLIIIVDRMEKRLEIIESIKRSGG